MTIKMKLGDVVATIVPLSELMKVEMPLVHGLRISKLFAAMASEARPFELMRNELMAKMGIPVGGKPGTFSFAPEAGVEFTRQVDEAAAVEVELPGDLLKLPEDIKVRPEVLHSLSKLLADA